MGLQELAIVTGMSMPALMALQSPDQSVEIAAIYNEGAFENISRQPSLRKLFADTFQLRSHLEMPMRMMDRRPFSNANH